jgi:hypothetical protein
MPNDLAQLVLHPKAFSEGMIESLAFIPVDRRKYRGVVSEPRVRQMQALRDPIFSGNSRSRKASISRRR